MVVNPLFTLLGDLLSVVLRCVPLLSHGVLVLVIVSVLRYKVVFELRLSGLVFFFAKQTLT